jgi:hypothetical protein
MLSFAQQHLGIAGGLGGLLVGGVIGYFVGQSQQKKKMRKALSAQGLLSNPEHCPACECDPCECEDDPEQAVELPVIEDEDEDEDEDDEEEAS